MFAKWQETIVIVMTGTAGAHVKINNFQQNKLTAMIRS